MPTASMTPAPFGVAVATAADRIGVSASTLRAWERRYGLGPSGRSAGGHRRYTAADLDRLRQVSRLVRAGVPTGAAADQARPIRAGDFRARSGRATGGIDRPAARFAELSDALDTLDLARLAARVLASHGAVDAWTAVFMPHLQALGERWARSGAAIEREHATVAVIQAALTRHVTRSLRAHPASTVVVAATPAEHHTLPLFALAAALAEHGVGTCLVGNLPAPALHAAIEETAPAAVVLWARSRTNADTATLRRLRASPAPVCAAGPGWPSRRGTARVDGLAGAVEWVLDMTLTPGR